MLALVLGVLFEFEDGRVVRGEGELGGRARSALPSVRSTDGVSRTRPSGLSWARRWLLLVEVVGVLSFAVVVVR